MKMNSKIYQETTTNLVFWDIRPTMQQCGCNSERPAHEYTLCHASHR